MASDERQRAAIGTGGRRSPRKPPAPDGHVGNALRTVYEQTVSETIPAEMLDLLGKLD